MKAPDHSGAFLRFQTVCGISPDAYRVTFVGSQDMHPEKPRCHFTTVTFSASFTFLIVAQVISTFSPDFRVLALNFAGSL